MDEDRELNMDFKRMTIKDVEALVRKKCDNVEVRNNWICMSFNHPATECSPLSATINVRVRRW